MECNNWKFIEKQNALMPRLLMAAMCVCVCARFFVRTKCRDLFHFHVRAETRT